MGEDRPMSTTQKVIESLEVCENACNEWECEFLASVKKQLDDGRDMTLKQLQTVDRIYDKVCDSRY